MLRAGAQSPSSGVPKRMTRRRLAVAGIALVAGVGVAATAFAARYPTPRINGFPGGPYFVVSCSSTHRNNDDPIVFFNQPGKSHNHTFVGNRSTDADSTPASLKANPANARCGPRTDLSAYWFPTLYERGAPVRPLVSIIYYVRRTNDTVRAFPPGLKMIAGNAFAKKAQLKSISSWSCGPPDVTRTYTTVPGCSENDLLHMNVNFPDCWDGRRLDSADHKSHMAYSTNGNCPSTHNVSVPFMRMLILYPSVAKGSTVSSGKFSEHGDFINAWDQDALDELVRRMNAGH
jgi:uncharacterized protein DUF1996